MYIYPKWRTHVNPIISKAVYFKNYFMKIISVNKGHLMYIRDLYGPMLVMVHARASLDNSVHGEIGLEKSTLTKNFDIAKSIP